MQLAETLFLLSIPITLLGAVMAAIDFRTARKQQEPRMAGEEQRRPLAYKPAPYRFAGLVLLNAFLLYEILSFSQYEHTYIDSARPVLWSIFGNYLARRIIIFGMITSSILIVTNTVQRVRSITRYRQAT